MSDGFAKRARVAEESYFDRQEREALEKLMLRHTAETNSPMTGQPMERIRIEGTPVLRCKSSGGIWLDKVAVKKFLPMLEQG